jgi:hypothetical protein
MELLPADLRYALPPLYSQERNKDPILYIKFFTPDSSWTWYVTEGQEEEGDFIFFGYVIGLEEEWGYFSLSELMAARGPLNLPIERDLYFTQAPFSKIQKRTAGALWRAGLRLPSPFYFWHSRFCISHTNLIQQYRPPFLICALA